MTRAAIEAIAAVSAMVARLPGQIQPPWYIASNVMEIHRIGRRLHRMHEADCNEAADPKRERSEARLEAKAKALGAELGIRIKVQGDPRGWPLIVLLPGATNTGSEPRLGGG